jgi:hypothetical protein
MKQIAIGLNILFLLVVSWLTLIDSPNNWDAKTVFLFFMFFAVPISSLLALIKSGGDNWLGLYLKRKALEEKRKIEQLGG